MPRPPFSPAAFFLAWVGFGVQSFGGGMVVLALIQRAAEKHGWVTEAEFSRDWALVQTAPGINLLGFAILLGRRVDGARGVVLALCGLLLPSAAATLLLTALYGRFATHPTIRAALNGLLPATVGLGLITAWKMVRPPLLDSQKEGAASLGVSVGLLAGSAVAASLAGNRLPVAVLLVVGGVVAAVYRWFRTRRQDIRKETPTP
jgi:chromate transporter